MTLAIAYILIIFLAAAGFALELRVARLEKALRALNSTFKDHTHSGDDQ